MNRFRWMRGLAAALCCLMGAQITFADSISNQATLSFGSTTVNSSPSATSTAGPTLVNLIPTVLNPDFSYSTADLTANATLNTRFSYVVYMKYSPTTLNAPAPASGWTNWTVTKPTTFISNGVTYSSATITGTPTAATSSTVALTAQNSFGTSSAKHLVIAVGAPNLQLVKTAAVNGVTTATVAKTGDTITYTITYTNKGNSAAQNVVITDMLPANTKFVSGSAMLNAQSLTIAPDSTGLITWPTINSVAANQQTGYTGTVSFKVTVQ